MKRRSKELRDISSLLADRSSGMYLGVTMNAYLVVERQRFGEQLRNPSGLHPLVLPRQHVHDGVLDKSGEDEDEAGSHPDVDRLRQRYRRHVSVYCSRLSGYRQDRQDSERYPRGYRIKVDPERYPGQDDYQKGGQVVV